MLVCEPLYLRSSLFFTREVDKGSGERRLNSFASFARRHTQAWGPNYLSGVSLLVPSPDAAAAAARRRRELSVPGLVLRSSICLLSSYCFIVLLVVGAFVFPYSNVLSINRSFHFLIDLFEIYPHAIPRLPAT